MSEVAHKSSAVHELRGGKRLVISMLSRVVRWLQSTYRYEGWECMEKIFNPHHEGSLILLWHNRILPAIGVFNYVGQGRRHLYTLASASRDGATISCFLEKQGITAVRGSSSRRGATAARELRKLLADGHHVAITLDGPRGPLYKAQPGAAFLMQLTGAPVYFLGVEAESCWEMRSWDRFMVPRPFSRVKILVDTLSVPRTTERAFDRDEVEGVVQGKLSALTLDTHRKP